MKDEILQYLQSADIYEVNEILNTASARKEALRNVTRATLLQQFINLLDVCRSQNFDVKITQPNKGDYYYLLGDHMGIAVE